MRNILLLGTQYTLEENDKNIILKMSKRICEQKRKYFVDNYKYDHSVSLDYTNINGFGAELAFCRLWGFKFDFSTIEKENHFKKIDCILPDGRSVDVKQTKYENGMLAVPVNKKKTYVNLFALMTGVFPSYTFKGWTTYEYQIQKKNIINLGRGPGYCLPQSEINKDLQLINKLTNQLNNQKTKNMDIKGKIEVVMETNVVSEKFKKREFVVKTDDQYPQLILCQLTQDKCVLLDKFVVGSAVTVHVNLRGRVWESPQGEKKYFNTIEAWRIEEGAGVSITQLLFKLYVSAYCSLKTILFH